MPTFQSVKNSDRLRRLLNGYDEPPTVPPDLLRLLVVDDEESVCFSLSEYFAHHGYEVDTASEIEEAQMLIESTDYNVVIQDLRLGRSKSLDGLGIVKLVHRLRPTTRIVVLTAYGSVETESEARRCGADAFLQKPKPLSAVAQVVQGLIEWPLRQAAKSA